MIRRPPRSTQGVSSAASDVYKRQYQRRVHGDCKMRLGREMVKLLYNEELAVEAEGEFVKVFQKKDVPTEIPSLKLESDMVQLADLLVLSGVQSKSESKRLIKQGGVKINDIKFGDPFEEIKLNKGDILRIGKRRFYKICLLYTSPSPRDLSTSRMPSSA
eukprot:TRINITY_DN27892_c0_g1_i1.p1 TRINITY_DN27892_c0_g1~~TRINITY_DN27892_c0_g1_i1.p1  ORF type:complete len:160 (+),score=46.99 TRINITY_DN27892_c0_g1_i1:117-596(+)